MPKATHTHTTGGVVSPSRRHLLGGSILTALSGAAFAGAVMLPDPGEASPADNPDAELIALCAQIERVQRRYAVLLDAAEGDDDEAEAEYDRLYGLMRSERNPLVQRATAMRAHTAAGHAARARMFVACDQGDMQSLYESWNTSLAAAVIRDLVAEAGA